MLKERIISLIQEDPGKAAQIVHEMIHTGAAIRDIA